MERNDSMTLSVSDEMYKYMNTSGEKPIIIRSAPEHIKNEAKEINKLALKYTGSEHYIIEE